MPDEKITLGSLFDGSGGFPLAGMLCGITPVWASEIEPYPLRVTALRFPQMEQLGDVLKIDGRKIKPVHVITFGSPCQDLSIAGKQAGIHGGTRSNLFFEAVRIIKEMREESHGEYPRWAVWENVPGALQSNGGDDFRAVLEALCRVKDPGVSIPEPPKGKWRTAGEIVGDGYSIAWRVIDAQYFGVPQRRRRIYLVADFGSERAGEILFEREGVHGNPAQGREAREGAPSHAEGSAAGNDRPVYALQGNRIERSLTSVYFAIDQQDGKGTAGFSENVAPTLMGDSHRTPHAVAYGMDCRNGKLNKNLCATLQAHPGGGYSYNCTHPVCIENGACYALDALSSNSMKSKNPYSGFHEESYVKYLDTSDQNPSKNQGGNVIVQKVGFAKQRSDSYTESLIASTQTARQSKDNEGLIVERAEPPRKYIVRRLTPTECCRLQGFPDWWEDGAHGSDSARYKLWGNGIALPCATFVLYGIALMKRGEETHG